MTDTAQGTPGQITVKMANKSGTPHDIVIDGKGKGEVVQNGGVSQFNADFAAGSYTFYCSVPGHRAGRHAGQADRQVAAPLRAYPLGALKLPLVSSD